jgi:pimeloyl-ACP methyl ester carboxylesterase
MNGIQHPSLLLDLGAARLNGDLSLPPAPLGLIIFAHGSGSSRHSSRNRAVAAALQQRHFATLLFDLLTEQEDQDYDNRFDIDLLTGRLHEVAGLMRKHSLVDPGLPVGYFGASTGAAAALRAAALPGSQIAAVVSRGGRPDLAGDALPLVRAPTLLIVGSLDVEVLHLNRQAQASMKAVSELAIVPGATHLFEEPGTLEQVAQLAGDWFTRHCR